MDKKKEKDTGTSKRSDYVETIRDGAIGANIFTGQTQDGMVYHYFKLSRAYKTLKQQDTDQFSYSDRFYPRNAEAISKVSLTAATRCDELDVRLRDKNVKQAA